MHESLQQPNYHEVVQNDQPRNVLPIGLEPKPGHVLVPRNEDGFLMLALPFIKPVWNVAKWPISKTLQGTDFLLEKVGVTRPSLLRRSVGGLAIVSVAAGFTYTRSETFLESGIDNSKATDTANVSVFDFSEVADIRAAVANSHLDMVRSNVIYNLSTPIKDIIPDFPRSKHMDATIANEIFVPLKDDPKNKIKAAIEQKPNPLTGKIDMLVHMENITGSYFYPGSGPVIENGQIKDGKFEAGDDQTTKDSLVNWVGASGSVLKLNGLRKTIENLDGNVESSMEVDGLKYANEECSDGLKPGVKNAINKALAVIAVELGRPDDLGKITFTTQEGKWVPKIDPYTNKVYKNGVVTGALNKKSTGIDKKVIKCNYDAPGLEDTGGSQ